MASQFLEWEDVMEYLKKHGKEIGIKAQSGDVLSKDIINWYTLHYKCPGDPGARAQVMILLDKYVDAQAVVV